MARHSRLREFAATYWTEHPLDTIERIRAARFFGNHASDGPGFEQIIEFAGRADVPMAQKVEAMSVMLQRGMGFEDPATEEDVRQMLETREG